MPFPDEHISALTQSSRSPDSPSKLRRKRRGVPHQAPTNELVQMLSVYKYVFLTVMTIIVYLVVQLRAAGGLDVEMERAADRVKGVKLEESALAAHGGPPDTDETGSHDFCPVSYSYLVQQCLLDIKSCIIECPTS